MKHAPKHFLPAAAVATIAATMGFMIAPIESLYITQLNPNGFVLGAVYALGSLLLVFFSLWFGYLADKGYRQRLIYLGLIAAIIYPLLYAHVISALQYAGVKPLWAIAGVATGPLLLGYIQDSLAHTNKKGVWFGYYYAATSLVGALAHFIGGFLAENIGLQAPFVAISILATINLFIAFYFLKPIQNIQSTNEKSTKLAGFSYFFTHPPLSFYLTSNIATGLNFGVKYVLWPLIIFELVGNNTVTGAVFATMGIVAFFILSSSRHWADKFNPYKIIILSLFLLAVGGFFIGTTQEIIIFWIAAAFFAIGEAIMGPPQAVILATHTKPSLRGRILAADDTIDKTLASISPLIAGGLLTITSPQNTFLFYTALATIACGLNYFLYKRNLRGSYLQATDLH